MSFDGFIFDFGGTLAHSEPAYREAFRHTIRLHTGLEIDETEFRDFWNRRAHSRRLVGRRESR